MKKLLTLVCVVIMTAMLGACSSEPEHTLSYVGSERLEILDQYDCIAIYTEYSNESSETAIPADWVDVKAFQNGVEIPIIVPSGKTSMDISNAIPAYKAVLPLMWYGSFS